MKIKKLLEQFTNEQILKQLFVLYPDQRENRREYINALNELRATKSVRSTRKILVEDGEEDDKKWVDILMTTKGERYSASFIPWKYWLEMTILTNKSRLDALCHCLWELTWYGFSDQETQDQWDELTERAKEIEKRNALKS